MQKKAREELADVDLYEHEMWTLDEDDEAPSLAARCPSPISNGEHEIQIGGAKRFCRACGAVEQ